MIPVAWQRWMILLGGIDIAAMCWWMYYVSRALREAREELARCTNEHWINFASDELDRKAERLEEVERENYKLQMEVARLTAQQEQNTKTVDDFRGELERKKMAAPIQQKDDDGHFKSLDGISGKEKFLRAAVMKRAGIDKDTIAAVLGIGPPQVPSYASRGKLGSMQYTDEECARLADGIVRRHYEGDSYPGQ